MRSNSIQNKLTHYGVTKTKTTVSATIKALIFSLVLFCVVFGIFRAKLDGYKNWTTRLLYYTFQSNVWIAIAEVLSLIAILKPKSEYYIMVIYRVRFIFITSIMMTATVFYLFLAPFAGEIINVWSPISVIFHGVVPLLSLFDFIIDDYRLDLKIKDCFLTLLPPIVYYSIAIILCYIKLDFGLGTPYPYPFLDVYSPSKMFGIKFSPTLLVGTFYWLLFFGLIMFIIALLLRKLNGKLKKVSEK